MAFRYKGPLHGYRVADSRRPIFDGSGAAQRGGRWNSPGHPAIYGSLTYAGALLEKLVQGGIGKIPRRQRWIELYVPGGIEIEEVVEDDVPCWDAPDFIASRAYGDEWLDEKRTAVLVVPSVIGQPHERNIVINPTHLDFHRLSASNPQPVLWDSRFEAAIDSGPEGTEP